MATLREWAVRLLGLLRTSRRDADLEEELRAHLALAADDLGRRDAAAAGAGREAAVRFGGVAAAMDAMRDQRGLPPLEQLWRDVRYALRALRRRPGFTSVVLVTMTCGLGANIAIFALVNGVLLKALPYPEPDRLVGVWQTAPGAPGIASVSGDLRLSPSMYFTYAEQNRVFDALGVWYATSAVVTGLAEPEEVRAVVVSDGTLPALAVAPVLGRPFTATDQAPTAAEVVMLNGGYWLRRFGGAPDVIGRSLIVDGRPRQIVGVMPAGFTVAGTEADLLVPVQFDRSRAILPGFGFQGVARLKPGVTIAEANADITRLIPIWMRSWPAAPGVNPTVYESWRIAPRVRSLRQDVVGAVERPLWLLLGTVGIVLLIACANVANLLLLRAEGRQQELAVRAALGAGRSRLVRTILIESLVLALASGALAIVLARTALRWVLAIGPLDLPRAGSIAIDPAVLLYAGAISILSGVLFGLVPALKGTRALDRTGLRSGGGRAVTEGRERHRTRSALVVSQVALAAVLLVGAALMLRTLEAMRTVEPGFAPSAQVQTLRIGIPGPLVPDPDRVERVQQDIVDKLRALPGVQTVAFASALPMDATVPDWDCVEPEGKTYAPGEIPPFRLFKTVSPAFFDAIGTPIVAGRAYSWADLYEHRRVVIVSESLAREFWGSASAALGKRFRTLPVAPWWQVVGVVRDVYENGVDHPAPATVYWPSLGESYYRAGSTTASRTVTIVIRGNRRASEAFLSDIRRAVWSVNASVPIAAQRSLQDIYDSSMAQTSFTLLMLGVAAGMGLLLGIVGLYGVVAYDVSRRTREIGIRLALGAPPDGVRRMFVRHGLALAAAGVGIGAVVAVALARLLSSLIFGVSVFDPVSYALVAAALAATTICASYLAAHRTSSVDPVEALRAE